MRHYRLRRIWIWLVTFQLPASLINSPKRALAVPMLHEHLQVNSHLNHAVCDYLCQELQYKKIQFSSQLFAWLMESCKCITIRTKAMWPPTAFCQDFKKKYQLCYNKKSACQNIPKSKNFQLTETLLKLLYAWMAPGTTDSCAINANLVILLHLTCLCTDQ